MKSLQTSRRTVSAVVAGALAASSLTTACVAIAGSAGALLPTVATAAEPLKVGVLLPGSRSDKGWMESGFDGVSAVQKAFGPKVTLQMIENINYADMEQALTTLAAKNDLVIGIGGQTQAAVFKIARRFPKKKFSIVGGNQAEAAANVAGYDVKQAQIAFVAGATAAMLSKSGVISYVGGMELPSIVNAGKEFGNGARYVNPKIRYIENYTGDFDNVAKAKEATLAAIAQGADIHYHILNLGLRGMEQAAREKRTHIIGSYSDRCGSDPTYVAYSITGVGYQAQYAVEQAVGGAWKAGYKPFGLAMGPQAADMKICAPTPAMVDRIRQIKRDILDGKIKVLEG